MYVCVCVRRETGRQTDRLTDYFNCCSLRQLSVYYHTYAAQQLETLSLSNTISNEQYYITSNWVSTLTTFMLLATKFHNCQLLSAQH